MQTFLPYLTAFLIGILSSSHCLGMCGGIISFLSINTNISNNKRLLYQLLYNIGRIFSYLLITLFISFLGFTIFSFNNYYLHFILKIFSNVLLIVIGIHMIKKTRIILFLENIGLFFSPSFSLIKKKYTPSFTNSLIIGFLWGYVPCGLVYSTIIWTISFGSIIKSLLLMLFFGFGTLPSMFFVSIFANKFNKIFYNERFKLIAGLIIIVFGTINIINLFFIKTCH